MLEEQINQILRFVTKKRNQFVKQRERDSDLHEGQLDTDLNKWSIKDIFRVYVLEKQKQHDRLPALIFPIHKKKRKEMHLLFKDLLIVILVSSRWNNRSLKVTIHISLVVCWLSWRGFEKSNVKHMGYNAFYKQYIYIRIILTKKVFSLDKACFSTFMIRRKRNLLPSRLINLHLTDFLSLYFCLQFGL